MSEKFKNKYRIPSARLQSWNYGWEASYFITICTFNKQHFFGYIEKDKMNLSYIGKIVEQEWYKTFEMRPDMNLQMGDFIIMPNHFHAIIHIGENHYNSLLNAETQSIASLHEYPNNKFGPQRKNLSSIIRGFKIGVTRNARLAHADFGWQERFHDHIIRNKQSYDKISNYIINNPSLWKDDKFYR